MEDPYKDVAQEGSAGVENRSGSFDQRNTAATPTSQLLCRDICATWSSPFFPNRLIRH